MKLDKKERGKIHGKERHKNDRSVKEMKELKKNDKEKENIY